MTNNTKRLYLYVGLPRSGKTTHAIKEGLPIVSRDAIRLALHGQPYLQEAEGMVTVIENCMVKALFEAGLNSIIIDATHNSEKRRARWKKFGCELNFVVFGTDPDICKQRARDGNRPELIPIIEHMVETHEPVAEDEHQGRIMYVAD